MRPLEELINREEPGMRLVEEWISEAEVPVEVLPPSASCAEALHQTQVTTRSPMGAIVYETGGLLIDGGWLRVLGSGHPRLTRTLPGWNEGRSSGFYLLADDAVGGFFALNGGGLGPDSGSLYYWPPDDLDWERMEIGYSEFLQWSLTPALHEFYADLRWDGWRDQTATLQGDRCFSFYPFLWTEQGSVTRSERAEVPVRDAFHLKVELIRQLREQG